MSIYNLQPIVVALTPVARGRCPKRTDMALGPTMGSATDPGASDFPGSTKGNGRGMQQTPLPVTLSPLSRGQKTARQMTSRVPGAWESRREAVNSPAFPPSGRDQPGSGEERRSPSSTSRPSNGPAGTSACKKSLRRGPAVPPATSLPATGGDHLSCHCLQLAHTRSGILDPEPGLLTTEPLASKL